MTRSGAGDSGEAPGPHPSGHPHIRLDQIAARARVSVATVSRALRGSPNISRVTRDAVEQARDALRAELSGGARRPVVGVIAGKPAGVPRAAGWVDPHFAQILAGVEAACLGQGAVPYPWQHPETLAVHGEPFLAGLDGAVVVGGVVEPALIALLAARGVPTVVAGGHVYRQPVNSVAPDYQQGAYLLTSHLLSLGHRRIVLFPGCRPATPHRRSWPATCWRTPSTAFLPTSVGCAPERATTASAPPPPPG